MYIDQILDKDDKELMLFEGVVILVFRERPGEKECDEYKAK